MGIIIMNTEINYKKKYLKYKKKYLDLKNKGGAALINKFIRRFAERKKKNKNNEDNEDPEGNKDPEDMTFTDNPLLMKKNSGEDLNLLKEKLKKNRCINIDINIPNKT